jgi:hypothetical protein
MAEAAVFAKKRMELRENRERELGNSWSMISIFNFFFTFSNK